MNTPAALAFDSPELPSVADRIEAELAACDDFATFCDDRRDQWVDALEGEVSA